MTNRGGNEQRSDRGWRQARLIPVSGIKGQADQEMRATSALLAVIKAVPQFGRALLKNADAPAGEVSTYIEVPLKLGRDQEFRPDGAITVTRGKTSWTALVEVKTGAVGLRVDQVESYLDAAREHGLQAVITISSEMTTAFENHPLMVDRRKTRTVQLYHWSWVSVLSEAIMQRTHKGIEDKDQGWILGELISYLEHDNSGALQFHDMGPHWVAIRDSAHSGTLRAADAGVAEVVSRWDQFMQYLCLFLGRDLGVKITQLLSRQEQSNPRARKDYLTKRLVDLGALDGTLKVPRAVGDITLSASLRGRTIRASVEVSAPDEGRSSTRVKWLVRQLDEAPPQTLVESYFGGTRSTKTARLDELRQDPELILLDDRTKAVKAFTVSLSEEIGTRRTGTEGFIGGAGELLLRFYREVVEKITPWAAAPPKLPTRRDAEDIGTQPDALVETVARELASEEAQPSS
ncbi:MAG: stress response protein [Dehalococcoidia bacterium]